MSIRTLRRVRFAMYFLAVDSAVAVVGYLVAWSVTGAEHWARYAAAPVVLFAVFVALGMSATAAIFHAEQLARVEDIERRNVENRARVSALQSRVHQNEIKAGEFGRRAAGRRSDRG